MLFWRIYVASARQLWLHLPVSQPTQNTATRQIRRRITVLYTGRVQGVGFRYTTKTVAAGFELTGIIRNLPNGQVELVAEGDSDELEAFREAIRNSGLKTFIHEEKIAWLEPLAQFKGFEIVR
jgi:acylphosphatase